MKKIISIILTLVILSAFSFSSFAYYYEDGVKFNLKIGLNPVVRVYGDGTYDITMYAYSVQGMTNGDLTVAYESDTEFTDWTDEGGADMLSIGEEDGIIYVSFVYETENEDAVAKLFTLTFKGDTENLPVITAQTLAGTSWGAVYDPVFAIAGTSEAETEETSSEAPEAAAYFRGDADGNGKITAADARLV
ncbi:MAG: hypothetical protein LUG85_00730, partial [Clostridiales bacterium]|nr:hypothetical protein [Clostridiales bacterium]